MHTQLYLTLCNPVDSRPPGSSALEILQDKLLEWVAISSFKGSSWPRVWICVSYVSCTGRQTLHWATWEVYMYTYACAQSLQLCPILCNPMDCSSSGSSIHGILQGRVLEWVTRSCRGSSWPRIEPRLYTHTHTHTYIYRHTHTHTQWLSSKFSLAWLNFRQVSSWLWASELPLRVFTLENLKLQFFFFDSVNCFQSLASFTA